MIACDLARCALVLLMVIRGMPLAALVVLLFVVTFVGAPFTAARAAVYPDVLAGDKYVMGTAVTLTTNQFAQVIGFVAGGTITGFLGIRTSLVTDAATFAASAVIVRAWVRFRPAPASAVNLERGNKRSAGLISGARLVFANPALRTPMLFGWLAAFYNAPEGVVTPLARTLGGGAVAVGVLLAAQALGETTGVILFSRFVAPSSRLRFMGPLAVASCAILVLLGARPGLVLCLLILAASGVCASYQLAANAAFVQAAPPEQRSQAFGIAQGGMSLGQGTVMILAGAAAAAVRPEVVIATCGAGPATGPEPTATDGELAPGAGAHDDRPPVPLVVLHGDTRQPLCA
jgi:hypothetical protein